MHRRSVMTVALAGALALVACSAPETPFEPVADDPVTQPSATDPVEADPEASEPDVEVAPDPDVEPESPEPKKADPVVEVEPVVDLPKLGELPEGVSPKWKPYFDALPFVMGAEKGLAKAKELNRPALLFYAATW